MDRERLTRLGTSRRGAAVLAGRIRELPPDAFEWLAAGAVFGREFQLDEAAALAGLSPQAAAAAAEETRRRRLVWFGEPGRACVFVHDRLRAAVEEAIPPDRRRDLHARAADRLEASGRTTAADLAHHLDSAGLPARCLPHALAAAEESQAHHAVRAAAHFFRMAERCAAEADRPALFRLHSGLADLLIKLRRLDEAAEQIRLAAPCAAAPVDRAHLLHRMGLIQRERLDLTAAVGAFEDGLRELGFLRVRLPASARIVGRAARAIGRWALRWTARPPGGRPLAPEERLAVFLWTRLASARAYRFQFSEAIAAHMHALEIAGRGGASRELAMVWNAHGWHLTELLPAARPRAVAFARRAGAMLDALGLRWGSAWSLIGEAAFHSRAARFREAGEAAARATPASQRAGANWESALVILQSAQAELGLGRLREAAAHAEAAIRAGRELGDLELTADAAWILAMSRPASFPDAEIAGALEAIVDYPHLAATYEVALGRAHLARGDLDRARLCLQAAVRRTDASDLPSDRASGARVWFADCLRAEAAAVPGVAPVRRSALLTDAARAGRRARFLARLHMGDRPQALRESALIAAMRGKERRARKWLDMSLRIAEKLEMRYEYGKSLLERGRLGRELGWKGHAEDLQRAEAVLRECGADFELEPGGAPASPPATLSLADRYASLLEDGRKIATSLSPEGIFAAARKSALDLLRGQACVFLRIVAKDPGAPFRPVGSEDPFVASFVQRAVSAARPLAFRADQPASEDDDLLAAGVRSALACPILVRGLPAAALYTAHREITGFFADEELRIAEFIAALTGAALENAEGFSELQRSKAELDLRVAERTAELARSNDELQQFAYVASHDLQEPLRKVSSYTQLLAKRFQGQLGPDADEFIGYVVDGATRMQHLIRDLLAFSRVGTAPKHFVPISLDACLDRALDYLSSSLLDAGAAVTREPLPTLAADAVQLTQLFQNLVGNAVKFRGTDPPTVHVGCRRDGDEWLISVSDNGIGISPEFHQRVFVAFERLHTRDEYPGTGIGLAVVKKVVERHGGTVAIESEPGKGATFHLRLPAADPSSAVRPRSAA